MNRIEEECNKLKELLLKKNNAYGNAIGASPVLCPQVGKETAILVRMSDKVSRIASLWNCSDDLGETFDDTIRDLAGYCILYLANKEVKEDQ